MIGVESELFSVGDSNVQDKLADSKIEELVAVERLRTLRHHILPSAQLPFIPKEMSSRLRTHLKKREQKDSF